MQVQLVRKNCLVASHLWPHYTDIIHNVSWAHATNYKTSTVSNVLIVNLHPWHLSAVDPSHVPVLSHQHLLDFYKCHPVTLDDCESFSCTRVVVTNTVTSNSWYHEWITKPHASALKPACWSCSKNVIIICGRRFIEWHVHMTAKIYDVLYYSHAIVITTKKSGLNYPYCSSSSCCTICLLMLSCLCL